MRKYLVAILISSVLAYGDDCSKTLSVCQQYVSELENHTRLQQDKITILIKQRDEANVALVKATEAELMPKWAWFVVGAASGVILYKVLER